MRVDCEKWIYTTLKENNSCEEQNVSNSNSHLASFNNKNDIVIEQKIQLEQLLYSDGSIDSREDVKPTTIRRKVGTHNGLDINFEITNDGSFDRIKMFELDASANSSASFINEINIPINQKSSLNSSNSSITWQTFQDSLDNSMDLYTFRQSIAIIEECIKLENYLNSEFQLNEKELFFATQKHIVEYLNQSLKKKLFSLSQSTELFNQQKQKLVRILKAKLSTTNLNDSLANFEQLEENYFQLVESIKSRLKFKIAKYEKNVQTWNEFDKNCRRLNTIFEHTNFDNLSNVEYRGLVIEISSCLNNLREQHSILSSTCNESKYFEMKNFIVLYELKFKKLKESYETSMSNQEFQLRYFTKSSEYEESYYNDNNNNQTNDSNNKQTEYCDEFYVTPERVVPVTNEISSSNIMRHRTRKLINKFEQSTTPQTEKNYSRPRFYDNNQQQMYQESPSIRKVETSDKSTFTVNEVSTQTDQFHNTNYLSNEQIINANHYSSKTFNKESTKHLTTHSTEHDGKQLLLEAYLRNNDELVRNENLGSSQSSSCLLNEETKKRKSLTTTETRESGIGTYIDDEVTTSSCDLEFVKVPSVKKTDFQTDDESLNKANDNSSLNDLFYTKKQNISKSFIKNKTTKRSESMQKLSQRQSAQVKAPRNSKKLNGNSEEALNEKTSWFSWFLKSLLGFFLFFMTIFFVIFVYFFYSLVINPSCCSFRNDYLLFNIS